MRNRLTYWNIVSRSSASGFQSTTPNSHLTYPFPLYQWK